MKYELIIVRYGEIGLKAKATRRVFESKLLNHIKTAFEKEPISYQIKRFRGRIFIYSDQIEKSLKVLQKIFGIISVSPAIKTTSDIDSMIKLAVDISKEKITPKESFALRVTRTGDHSFTSRDVAVGLGDEIVKATSASVDLSNPDFELSIEIRDDDAYFFVEKLRGTGGLPYCSQGKVLALIDSKRSILASWYMLRRGCNILFVTKDTSLQELIGSFSKDWYVDESKVMINSNSDFKTIAYKQNCEAVVTGHIINDFSEIEKLKVKVELPILTPLISMDEKEINEKTQKIGLQL